MRPPIPRLQPRPGALEKICWQCARRALRQVHGADPTSRFSRPFSQSALPALEPRQRLRPGYFLSNTLLARFNGTSVASSHSPAAGTSQFTATASEAPPDDKTLLPHRRRQAAKRAAAAAAATSVENAAQLDTASTTASAAPPPPPPPSSAPTNSMATSLPPDASSRLADSAAAAPAHSLRRTLSALLSLAKPRLTVLVVLSAMVPYALYPVPAFLDASTASTAAIPSLSPLTLLFLTTGTTLCSAAANALNMLYEPDTDARMTRTRTRPLVRRLLTTRAAVLFAVGCAAAGTAALYFGVNPTVAFLGAANIALYAGAYTPLKRISAVNTWVGALVGGIPPLMGWAAAAGECATSGEGATWKALLFASDGSSLGGWLFAGLLFAWQFPHFMPLSWGIREEYRAAGLRMLAWVNPARNGRVALRYSLVFVPLCVGLCAAGVTEWSFAVTSLPVNVWLVREAVKFWMYEGHKRSARGLFWASVWHLPVVMVLALAQKKGMWARVWKSVAGEPEEEEEGEYEYEEDDEAGTWVAATTSSAASGAGAVGAVGPVGPRR